MQPLIKWPGGKTKEFPFIEDLIPVFDRYVEPFFGGGAIFFQLQPKKAIVNDICSELTDFYNLLKAEANREKFKEELYAYVTNWEKIPQYMAVFKNQIVKLYEKYRDGDITKTELAKQVSAIIDQKSVNFDSIFSKKFCLDRKNLSDQIKSNLISKITRTVVVEKQRGRLPVGDLQKNIETAFRSGFYMHFRDIMNFAGDRYTLSLPKKIANYYFIREFCYGSMFRFNTNGHFNIPYGGIGYNAKDFRGKVDYIFSDEVRSLLKNAIVDNEDFEDFFKKYKFSKNDFMFLDPPYDTDFSSYEKKSFGRQDQERLARRLCATKAKFILIIKNTPFIYGLYRGKKGITIEKFEKTYLYNVKGRNDRNVEHLVIYNF